MQSKIQRPAAPQFRCRQIQCLQTCTIKFLILCQQGGALFRIEHIEQKLRHEMGLVGQEQIAAIAKQFVP